MAKNSLGRTDYEGQTDAAKAKALSLAMKQIEKDFGKGSIMRLGDAPTIKIEAVPTGSLALDYALGVGGVPRGRIVEIYGPESSGKTTLATHIIAEAQKIGGVCAFIDAEHAFDASYAEKLGVNIEDLIVSQPDTGEQALEICDALVRSGALDVVVIDSVAALVPRAEIEGDMGDSHMGLQARLMSQALRKLTGTINRTRTVLIFINQIRMKIGVMFGCFHYNARVTLADGTTEKIGKIVNQRMPVEVMSYNAQTGAIEPRRVVNWFNNGKADYFLQFEVEGGPSGRRSFGVTPNHMILTPTGEIPAGDLREGDEVLAMVEDYYLTDDQVQLLLGSALGDGSMRQAGTHTAMLRVARGEAQRPYVEWKHEMLEPFSGKLGSVGNGTGFDTLSFPTLAEIRTGLYDEAGGRQATAEVLDQLDARLNGSRLKMRTYRRAVSARIRKIYIKPKTRSMNRFDIEVEGNHTYLVDGVVVHNSPETTTGGRALKFYASVRMDIRRIGAIKDGSEVVGNRTRVKVVKNKVAPPFREVEFDIIYGEGISSLGELIDLALQQNILQKAGSWYSYGEIRIGQGRDATKQWLKDNPDLRQEIKEQVKVELGMLPASDEPVEDDS